MSIMSLRRDTQASGEGTAGQKKLRQETEPAGTLGSNPDKAGRGSSVIWGCFGPGSSQQKDGCEHSACEGRTPPAGDLGVFPLPGSVLLGEVNTSEPHFVHL